MTPADTGRLSLGQWAALVRQHNRDNGAVAPPTEAEFREAVAKGFD